MFKKSLSLITIALFLFFFHYANGENYLRNASFETGNEITDMLFWNRMEGVGYTMNENCGWQLDKSTAYDGKQSLKGGNKKSLLIPAEIHEQLPNKKPWIFSVYMKADGENLPCEIKIGSYKLLDEDCRTKKINVGKEWKMYDFVIDKLYLNTSRSRTQGPFNFHITPLDEGSLWVDAVQWEPGNKASSFTLSECDRAQPLNSFSIIKPYKKIEVEKINTVSEGKPISVPISAFNSTKYPLSNAAVQLGVPFASGKCDGKGEFSVEGSSGKIKDIQTEKIAQWPENGSIESLELNFETDLVPGENKFILKYNPETENTVQAENLFQKISQKEWKVSLDNLCVNVNPAGGAVWDSVIDKNSGALILEMASIEGIGQDGEIYSSMNSPETITEVEKDGPVYVSTAKRGILCSAKGNGLLMYIARLHLRKKQPGINLEITLINSQKSRSIALRELYLKTKSAENIKCVKNPSGADLAKQKGELKFLQHYDYAKKQFVQTSFLNGKILNNKENTRGPVWLEGETPNSTLHLQVRNGWQQHPSMLGIDSTGNIKAYMWPGQPVTGLEFTSGMSITRDFIFAFAKNNLHEAERDKLIETSESPVIAMTAPEWFQSTNILMPVSKANPKKFPYIEKLFTPEQVLGRLSEKEMESRRLYGLFNYGDITGDGGWANLESYVDYAIILSGLSCGSPEILKQGLTSARHYRDIDINQNTGATLHHTFNHVMGGNDFGHAWPQGVGAHYLLTGSRRSVEVLMRNGEYMLSLPIDYAGIKDCRNLGRFLICLADAYQISGDERFKNRFMEQLAYAGKKMMENSDRRDDSIFTWNSRLDPFHVWYGTTALLKMYRLTGNKDLLKSIHREVKASMNMDFYKLDLKEMWPGLPPEKGWPIAIALYNARHRGSMFYPMMLEYSRITGDAKWIKLALLSLYVDLLEGRSHNDYYSVFRTAPLLDCPENLTEKELIDEAKNILWDASSPSLLNGDFSMSPVWWKYWRPSADRQMGHDDLIGKWDITTAGSGKKLEEEWRAGKNQYVSAWQYYRRRLASLDNTVYKSKAPSLRINLGTDWIFGKYCSIDTARIRMEPGTYRFTGWFKADNIRDAWMRIETYPLDGRFTSYGFYLYPVKAKPESSGFYSSPTEFKTKSVTLTSPDNKGWFKMAHEFEVPYKCIIDLRFMCYLAEGSKEGHFWLDDVELKKLENNK